MPSIEASGTEDENESNYEASMDNSMLSGCSMDTECSQEGSKDDDYDAPTGDGEDSTESESEDTLRSELPVRKEPGNYPILYWASILELYTTTLTPHFQGSIFGLYLIVASMGFLLQYCGYYIYYYINRHLHT